MMKKTIVLLLVFALCATLAACGSAPAETDPSGAEQTGNPSGTPSTDEHDLLADLDPYEKPISDYIKLGRWSGFKLEMYEPQATEAEIDAMVNALLLSKAEYKDSTLPAELNDNVNIDFAGYIDGELFEGGSAEGYTLILGSGSFIDNFEDQLVGAKPGDTVDVYCTFPDYYPNNPDLQGVEAHFVVTLNSLQKPDMPTLSDSFISENTTYSTIQDYRDYLTEYITTQNEISSEQEAKATLFSYVAENAELIAYPEEGVEQLRQSYHNYYKSYAMYMNIPFDTFREAYLQMDEEAYDAFLDETARDTIFDELIYYALIREIPVTLTQSEYADLAGYYASLYQYSSIEEAEEDYGKDYFCLVVAQDKILDILMENAEITMIPRTE